MIIGAFLAVALNMLPPTIPQYLGWHMYLLGSADGRTGILAADSTAFVSKEACERALTQRAIAHLNRSGDILIPANGGTISIKVDQMWCDVEGITI